MAQARLLIDVLKKNLRAQGLTYADVAKGLGLSEAAVKRMFSIRSFTLQRLEAICQLMGMELTDLVRTLDEAQHRLRHLTREQEQELISDTKLLLVAICVRNRWSFEDITQTYALTSAECIRLLARLDRLKLIDLLPNNRIKLRIADDFRWLPEGPIERFFEAHVQKAFLQSRFRGEDARRLFLTGTLTRASTEILFRKLEALATAFAELHKEDTHRPVGERENVCLMLAMRPWQLPAFAALRRVGKAKASD